MTTLRIISFKRFFVIVLILVGSLFLGNHVLYCAHASSQNKSSADMISIHKQIVTTFSKAQCLKVVTSANSGMKVTVTAKRSNKFKIEMSDRIVLCNGKYVWNYTPTRKQVTKSLFTPQNTSISLESIFFDVLTGYLPSTFKSENSSNGGAVFALTLVPSSAPVMNIQSLTLILDKNTSAIKRIVINSTQGKQEWNILSLTTELKLPDSFFIFKPNKSIEIIDLG